MRMRRSTRAAVAMRRADAILGDLGIFSKAAARSDGTGSLDPYLWGRQVSKIELTKQERRETCMHHRTCRLIVRPFNGLLRRTKYGRAQPDWVPGTFLQVLHSPPIVHSGADLSDTGDSRLANRQRPYSARSKAASPRLAGRVVDDHPRPLFCA
jgi:hypothetical protein